MLVTAACILAALVAVVLPALFNAVRQWWLLRSIPVPPLASLVLGHAPHLMSTNRCVHITLSAKAVPVPCKDVPL